MKQGIKRVLSCLITLGLIVFIIAELSPLFRPEDTADCQEKTRFFYSLPKNSVEVMIYGSSHAFRGVSTEELYAKYGIGAYNYAWNWQRIDTTRLFIEDSLAYQRPKVALIDTFHVYTVNRNADPTAEIFTSKYLRNKPAVKEYLKNSFGSNYKSYIGYYLPLLVFHENWNVLSKGNFDDAYIGDYQKRNMGYCRTDGITPLERSDIYCGEQSGLTADAKEELDKIVSICKANGIRIVFFTTPYYGNNAYHDLMKEYSEANDCIYVDFFEVFDEAGFDVDKDFSDRGHMNVYGAEKVSDYLGKVLKENFDLTDMRGIKDNLWEKSFYGDSADD